MKCVCSPSVSFSSYTVITRLRLTARLFPSSALPLSLYLSLSHSKSAISCIITRIIIGPSVLLLQEACFCFSGVSCLSFLEHTHTDTDSARTPLPRPPFRLVVRLVLSLSFVSSSSEARACSNIGKTAEQIQFFCMERRLTPRQPCFLINYSFRHHKPKEP